MKTSALTIVPVILDIRCGRRGERGPSQKKNILSGA
jgi:hypothetical protein